MYVHHAKNMLEGKAYADTGFIYNPAAPLYAPRTYPPGFPLMLIPWYAIFGLDLFWLKMPAIACLVLALVVTARCYQQRLSLPVLLLLIASVGANPFLWHFKDFILSDFPFLLFVMIAALRIGRTRPEDQSWQAHLLTGCSIYSAYAIRPLGALFILALFLFDVTKNRAVTRRLVIVTSTFAALALVQFLVFPRDGSYFEMLRHYERMGLAEVWADLCVRFTLYRTAASGLWMFGADYAEQGRAYSDAFLAIVLVGLLRKLRQPCAVDLFVVLYLVAILIFPGFQGPRYLIPVLHSRTAIPLLLRILAHRADHVAVDQGCRAGIATRSDVSPLRLVVPSGRLGQHFRRYS